MCTYARLHKVLARVVFPLFNKAAMVEEEVLDVGVLDEDHLERRNAMKVRRVAYLGEDVLEVVDNITSKMIMSKERKEARERIARYCT